jgi:predicted 3-demethylubiquinone-9 3-methyltransferase (glyoxalase superfamily)
MKASFLPEGQKLIDLNGGPEFKFPQIIYFVKNCDSPDEIDR